MGSSNLAATGDPGVRRSRWTSSAPTSQPVTSTPSSCASPTCRAGCRANGSHAPYFVETSSRHGTEGCNYLLAVDVDMNTVDGYAMSIVAHAGTATS